MHCGSPRLSRLIRRAGSPANPRARARLPYLEGHCYGGAGRPSASPSSVAVLGVAVCRLAAAPGLEGCVSSGAKRRPSAVAPACSVAKRSGAAGDAATAVLTGLVHTMDGVRTALEQRTSAAGQPCSRYFLWRFFSLVLCDPARLPREIDHLAKADHLPYNGAAFLCERPRLPGWQPVGG